MIKPCDHNDHVDLAHRRFQNTAESRMLVLEILPLSCLLHYLETASLCSVNWKRHLQYLNFEIFEVFMITVGDISWTEGVIM